jgi:hypothetical protein
MPTGPPAQCARRPPRLRCDDAHHRPVDPEARATLDAVLATWAAPGSCNPDDDTPCVDEQPAEAVADRDLRSQIQRNHDALTAMGRAVLASGQVGQHNGLPATIIVSTTLQELESGHGQAVTGGAACCRCRTTSGSPRMRITIW